MMNRETDLLIKIGNDPNVINLKQHFYSATQAGLDGFPPLDAPESKKYLNLVTDFMPLTLAKFNQISRVDETSVC
jgi:hypothetical protein